MGFSYKHLMKLIGIVIFIFLLWRIDVGKAVQIIAEADLILLVLALALAFGIFIARTIRWQTVLRVQGHKYRFVDLFKSNLGGSYFASITPGQIGEFIKVVYLNQYKKIPPGLAFSSIVLDRFMNIPILLVIGIFGVLILPIQKEIQFLLIGLFAVILLGLGLVVLSKRFIKKICKKLVGLSILSKRKAKLKKHFRQFYTGVNQMISVNGAVPVLVSVAALGVVFLQAYVIAKALGIDISFLFVCVAVAVSMIVALIPVSFVGLGTRDAVLVVVFGAIGLSAESAISFSFLFLLSHYILVALVGAYVWFRYPLDHKAIKKQGEV